jgi:hypothetical protein
MSNFLRVIGLGIVVLLVAACSSTTLSGSWADPAFKNKIKNVYIIGIAKNETTRRIFEDAFSGHLGDNGVRTVSSYKDLPNSEEATREDIIKGMTDEGCDSVLLTKLVGQRKETVTTPGRVSGYSSGGYGNRGGYYGNRGGYYNNWGSYYGRRHEVVYTPPTSTEFTILTVESVLYDLETEKMIWSGQFETVVEQDIEKNIKDFVIEVSKDMADKGII